MSKLYTYIVRHDLGLAPNPFWGWCTLAVCTPNHQGSRVAPGHWIAGFLSKSCEHRFLYAMEVSEVLEMDEYFADRRFLKKRPQLDGTWKQQRGDNFYSRDNDNNWVQHPTHFHRGSSHLIKDTKNPRVFVAKAFWYLGRNAHPLPEDFRPLVGGRGARVNHDPALIKQFKMWVRTTFVEGVIALPFDIDRRECSPDCAVQPTAR